MKITIDTAVLGTLDAGVAAANKGATAGAISIGVNLGVAGTPLIVTAANITDTIVDMGTVLDEQNMPETGRWLVIPPWIGGLIKKSDLSNASISGDGVSLLRNGRMGMIDRFTLYSSNLLPKGTDTTHKFTRIFGGLSSGLTFASQLSNVETMRSEITFGTLLRGLHVYGSKVLDGTALVEAYVAPS